MISPLSCGCQQRDRACLFCWWWQFVLCAFSHAKTVPINFTYMCSKEEETGCLFLTWLPAHTASHWLLYVSPLSAQTCSPVGAGHEQCGEHTPSGNEDSNVVDVGKRRMYGSTAAAGTHSRLALHLKGTNVRQHGKQWERHLRQNWAVSSFRCSQKQNKVKCVKNSL